jgi:hypothetical protein
MIFREEGLADDPYPSLDSGGVELQEASRAGQEKLRNAGCGARYGDDGSRAVVRGWEVILAGDGRWLKEHAKSIGRYWKIVTTPGRLARKR